MSVYEAILELIGPVPAGYEPIAWIFAGLVLLYLPCSVFSLIASVVNWIAGR